MLCLLRTQSLHFFDIFRVDDAFDEVVEFVILERENEIARLRGDFVATFFFYNHTPLFMQRE